MTFVTDSVSVQARGNTFGHTPVDWAMARDAAVRRLRRLDSAQMLRVIKLSRKAGQLRKTFQRRL